jgi:hypothetical protein
MLIFTFLDRRFMFPVFCSCLPTPHPRQDPNLGGETKIDRLLRSTPRPPTNPHEAMFRTPAQVRPPSLFSDRWSGIWTRLIFLSMGGVRSNGGKTGVLELESRDDISSGLRREFDRRVLVHRESPLVSSGLLRSRDAVVADVMCRCFRCW